MLNKDLLSKLNTGPAGPRHYLGPSGGCPDTIANSMYDAWSKKKPLVEPLDSIGLEFTDPRTGLGLPGKKKKIITIVTIKEIVVHQVVAIVITIILALVTAIIV
jgi:hypothetical protein